MIQIIRFLEECRNFLHNFCGDPDFLGPILSNEEQLRNELTKAIEKPEKHTVWGVFREGHMTGLFSFLILPDEQYMEMLAGLSRDKAAYQEMLTYLEQNFPNYEADFVFDPRNDLLKEQLQVRNAKFETEQQKMVLGTPVVPDDTTGAVPYAPQYEQQYCAIHDQNVYWTGEKIVSVPERFKTIMAIHDGKVVGYLDMTKGFTENEIFDVLVLENYRRMGYGRKLLAMAIEVNRPNGMMLTVDVDNVPAIRLYRSVGFSEVENENSLTAHWMISGGRKVICS